jgi:hypothetical protein
MSTKPPEVKDLKVLPFLINGKHETTTACTFPLVSNQLQRELFLAQSADSTTATAAADAASVTNPFLCFPSLILRC